MQFVALVHGYDGSEGINNHESINDSQLHLEDFFLDFLNEEESLNIEHPIVEQYEGQNYASSEYMHFNGFSAWL